MSKYKKYKAIIQQELMSAQLPINFTEVARNVLNRNDVDIDTTPELFRKIIRRIAIPMGDLEAKKPGPVDNEAKILIFDIETAPMLNWNWSRWKDFVPSAMVEQEGFILTWSAKWLNDTKIYNDWIGRYRTPSIQFYTQEDEREVVMSAHKMIDEADVIIGHNIDKFDVKKFNTSCVALGLKPPSPYRTIDTLKVAKKHFKFSSNRLDDLGEFLGCGRKVETGGFRLWRQCMEGDLNAFDKMVKYCDGDILLNEEVYHRLLPFISNHPNVAIFGEHDGKVCTRCGSDDLHWTGDQMATKVALYNKFYCGNCFGWGADRANSLPKSERQNITKTI
jgi:hypothetical protein